MAVIIKPLCPQWYPERRTEEQPDDDPSAKIRSFTAYLDSKMPAPIRQITPAPVMHLRSPHWERIETEGGVA